MRSQPAASSPASPDSVHDYDMEASTSIFPLQSLVFAYTFLKGSPLHVKAGKVSILCRLLQEAGHHRGSLLCVGGVVVGRALGIGKLRTWRRVATTIKDVRSGIMDTATVEILAKLTP